MGNALLWLICLVPICGIRAHREHKIHNIILYPHKHSWCEIQEIKQVISFPGCKSIEIDNNVCVGACFSYSIPHTEPSDPGEVIVPYCDSCQPSDTKWHDVTLDCREGHQNDPEQSPKLVKRVQLIRNCSCSSCEKDPRQSGHGDDDDLSLLDGDAPDLLDIHMLNDTHAETKIETKHRENLRSILNNTLMNLLKNIQESNSPKDKAQLKDLLKMIRDQYPDENYSDESIAEIVESFNSDQISLDIPKLKEILFKFELSRYNHERPLETNEVHHFDRHHKHHHSGEAMGGGHLSTGPHGSLVVDPLNIHSKLDVHPNEFKPNHEGTMVSYDSHHPGQHDEDVSGDE